MLTALPEMLISLANAGGEPPMVTLAGDAAEDAEGDHRLWGGHLRKADNDVVNVGAIHRQRHVLDGS
jgi:hypothetical protein